MSHSESRRDFLYNLAGLAAGALYLPLAKAETVWERPRAIWIERKETKESVHALYWENNALSIPGYVQLCHILRDVQANQTVRMDPMLLDIMFGLQAWFSLAGQHRKLLATSGYRSRGTNGRTEGAARDSRHMRAEASDLKMEDVPMEYLGQLALYIRGGGVGFYADGHVHVDSGPIRQWRR
jgi:uncharacterized protein YcbK (DUF882 family)